MIKYLLLFSLLFIGGCKNNSSLQDSYIEKVIYKSEKKDILESGVIKEIKLIPLETTPECLFSFSDLCIKDTDYYLSDYFNNKGVFRFNAEGKFLNRIGRVGNGPEEYIDLSDFSFDNLGNILLYFGMEESVACYSKEGVFKNKIQLNHYFHKAIRDNENNFWLYRGHYYEQSKSLLTKLNDKGEVLFYSSEDNYNIISITEMYPVFSQNKDIIFMRQSFSRIIYQIIDTVVIPRYEFDFGSYNIPNELYNKNSIVEAGELLFTIDFAMINRFIENDDYILVDGTISISSTSERIVKMIYGIKNKNKEEWKWFEINQDMNTNHIFILALQQISENNELIGIIDAWKLKEWENRDIFVNPEVIDQLKEDDNPVIMVCKLAW